MKKAEKTVFCIVLLLALAPLHALYGESGFKQFFQGKEKKIIRTLSIEEKVGQIFIFGFAGDALDADYSAWLASGRLGNVKIFARNVDSRNQLRDLTDTIARLSEGSQFSIPPFIATDLEGGAVNHIRYSGMPTIPPAATISSRKQCVDISRTIAVILTETGINMNFAPCADVRTNPDNTVIGNRSYSSDPRVVYTMVRAFIIEHEKAGIVPVAKHFPGHGMTDFDSHYKAKSVDTRFSELRKIHLLPYRRLIGKSLLHSVMLAHVTYSAIDPNNPATFSPLVVDQLLRKKMHFRGITVTDDLEMESSERYAGGIEQAFIRAFEAGNDLFLVAHSKRKQALLLRRVPELLRSGVLSEDELDRKVLRVLRTKKKSLRRFYAIQARG